MKRKLQQKRREEDEPAKKSSRIDASEAKEIVLPVEIIDMIFRQDLGIKDVLMASSTCKVWRAAASKSSTSLWRSLFYHYLPTIPRLTLSAKSPGILLLHNTLITHNKLILISKEME